MQAMTKKKKNLCWVKTHLLNVKAPKQAIFFNAVRFFYFYFYILWGLVSVNHLTALWLRLPIQQSSPNWLILKNVNFVFRSKLINQI